MARIQSRKQKKVDQVSRRAGRILAGIAAAVVVVAIGLFWRMDTLVPGGSVGGPFTLEDQTGHTVTEASYRGKLMLIYFGYTYCPDICPTTLGGIGRALDQLTPQQRAQIVPIFISVDPKRDTVDQLSQYVRNFMPDLVGLTGSPDQVQSVMREFRVYAKKVPGDGANYTVDHSSILYLMDRQGKFLKPFPGSIPSNDLAAALKKAL